MPWQAECENGVLGCWIKTRVCGVRYYKGAEKRLRIFGYRIAGRFEATCSTDVSAAIGQMEIEDAQGSAFGS